MSSRIIRWLLHDKRARAALDPCERERLDGWRLVPFVAIHLCCLLAPVVGVSAVALASAAALYLVRMFFVTAFYHRYFSHRSYRVSRPAQLVLGVLGCTAGQRGPLWWASHHRQHHLTADTPADPHSPAQRGFLVSHMLWFLTRENFTMREERVRDWLRYPELEALERFDWLPFVMLGALVYGAGEALETWRPALGTNGPQMLVWGFFVSTVALYHATYTINSLAHGLGRRRYETGDDSRNNWWLALITLGEGWHNNHHYCPGSARQGFYWWEIDLSYLGLRALAALGVVRDLRTVPAAALEGGRRALGAAR